jgi:hypothetical protein
MSNNQDFAVKGRIGKLEKKIREAGLEVPSTPENLSLTEREAALKNFVANIAPKDGSTLQSLRAEADKLGLSYDNETPEDQLKEAVNQTMNALRTESEERTKQTREAQAAEANGLNLKEFGKELAAGIAAGLRDKKEGEERFVNERDFDPNDLGEDRTYFAPMLYWKLPAKRIGGQLVKAPFGKIEFKLLEGSSVRTGNRASTRYLSAYTTNSKKEQAYIESHPLYRKTFFPSEIDGRMAAEDVRYAVEFGKQMNMLLTYQAPALYKMASDLHNDGVVVNHTMSLDTIRTNIAGALAKRAIRAQRDHIATLMQEQSRRELLDKTLPATP